MKTQIKKWKPKLKNKKIISKLKQKLKIESEHDSERNGVKIIEAIKRIKLSINKMLSSEKSYPVKKVIQW